MSLCLVCGGHNYVTYGQISSPAFPQSIGTNLNCIWTITGQHDNDYVQLKFSVIDVKDDNKNCSNNYISFGDSKDQDKLPRYCNQVPVSKLAFSSDTREVVIKLVTGSSSLNDSKGFTADFKVFSGGPSSVTTGHMIDTTPRK